MEQHFDREAEKGSERSTRCVSCRELETGPCVLHCRDLVPDEVFSRAICSLPSQLIFRVIQHSSVGGHSSNFGSMNMTRRVFARQAVPAGTVYGPLIAELVLRKQKGSASRFGVVLDGRVRDFCLDSDMFCNWMKYVRFSHAPSEVNMMAYQHAEAVYFTVVKRIVAGDELCVGYSFPYAKSIGKVAPDVVEVDVGSRKIELRLESLPYPGGCSLPNSVPEPLVSKVFAYTNAPPKTASRLAKNAKSSLERPGRKRKSPEEGTPAESSTVTLKAIRLRDILPKPPSDLSETIEKVVEDAQNQLRQLNQVNRIRSAQINTIEHLGSDKFDNRAFESNIPRVPDVQRPFEQTPVQDEMISVGAGTFILPDDRLDPGNREEVSRPRDDSPEYPIVPREPAPSYEDHTEEVDSNADSDKTWSLPAIEESKKKKKRTVRKKSPTKLPKIPKKLLSLGSSLPEPDDGPPIIRRLKKKKVTIPQKEIAPIPPEEKWRINKIISGTVENDLLGNLLLKQLRVKSALTKKKNKLTIQPTGKQKKDAGGTSTEALVTEAKQPKKKKVDGQENKPRPKKHTKRPCEIDTLMQNSVLPSASKLLVENQRYKFRCDVEGCMADFRLPGLLAIHATKHGAEMPEELKEPGPKSCPGCVNELPDAAALVEHISEHERQYLRHKQDYIPCDICGYKLRSEKYLKIHKQRVHSGEVEKEFACKDCPKAFFTLAGLRSHENFHKEKGYSCPVCLESFMGGLALNVHSEKHRVDGKFPCRICDKIYDSWLPMRRHMKQQHLKAKTLVCSVCRKVCKRISDLKKHMLVHSDVYAFSCDVCGRRFKRLDNMEGHKQRLHHPDRQYQMKDRSEKVARSFADAVICEYCTRQYCNEARLLEHQRIKHGKHLFPGT